MVETHDKVCKANTGFCRRGGRMYGNDGSAIEARSIFLGICAEII